MWRNYLTVGFRALVKNRTYAFINVFGLAVGMAACLMILLYVRYETSYDDWLPGVDRAFELQFTYAPIGTSERRTSQMAPYVAGRALAKDFPQIERVVHAASSAPVLIRNGRASSMANFVYVDGPLFDILRIPFIRGDERTALAEPGSAVMTQKEARRLFGSADPMGKTLTFSTNGKRADYRVTGIVRDVPKNSHLSLSVVARYDPTSFWQDEPEILNHWGSKVGWVYVKLKQGADPKAIVAALPGWEKRNIPIEVVDGRPFNPGDAYDWNLVNVRDIHLGEAQLDAMTPGNDRTTVATFVLIAMLILGLACVNFVNLTTARASQRAREVALRKVLGARRGQLIFQFMGESLLLAAFAMVIGLALVELLLPWLDHFLDADLRLDYLGSSGLIWPIVGVVLAVGIGGGLYPAFYLARFEPAKILKANKSAAESSGTGHLRNILVISQFAVSIGLIICTVVISAQTRYVRTSDPGFARAGLLQIGGIDQPGASRALNSLIREIRSIDGVRAVGRSDIGINTRDMSDFGVLPPNAQDHVTLGRYSVDTDFFRTLGLPVVAGRNFSEARALDDATILTSADRSAEAAFARRGINVLVNELAARRLGFASAADAIGKQVRAHYVDDEFGLVPATIVGVVADARFRSARDPIEPIMYAFSRTGQRYMIVRFDGGDPNRLRDRIETVWKRLVPDEAFNAAFVEDVDGLYKADEARAQTFAGFALLAVIIACLGLFGLASFTVERRTKEIGVRKVLGARSRDIVRLLVWQFTRPVIVANLIAWPAAWWVMRDWLNGFDARIALGPTPFVLAGALALAIAIGTVAGHALKVARLNPIHALRYE